MKRRKYGQIVSATLIVMGALIPGTGAAQEASQNEVKPSAPICMVTPLRNVQQVSQAQRGQAFRLVVAASDVPALEKAGFAVTDCTTADLATANKRGGWRDEICEIASFGNEAVQQQITRAIGASSAVLCGSAEVVAGPWQRGRGRN